MGQPNAKQVGLDEVIQEIISALELGKDQVLHLARLARTEQETLARTADSLRRRGQVQGNEADRLEEGLAEASRGLDELLKAGMPDPGALLAAVDRLADARADLRVARDRQKDFREQSLVLDDRGVVLTEVADGAIKAASRISALAESMAGHIRQLGSRLESARQSRGLGLHVIRAQEEERRRLAREIHDGPAQLLNSVVLRINVCQKLFDTDLPRLYEELNQLKELVRLSLQDVRKIIFDLRPMALDDLGLVPALRTFLKDFQARTGVEADFVFFGNDRRYDSAFEVALFRMVQEALNNVYKHAGASRVWVKLETTGGREVRLTVRDDGAGFDPGKVPQGGGGKFGLVGMRERAELLRGTMEVLSAPGQGTRLNFIFPITD